MASSPRKHTPEFKQRAVQLWRELGTTYAEVARGLGIDESPLRAWVHKADGDAPRRDGGEARNPFQMEEELKRLRRENAQLRRDNEILLKASALFASRQL